MGRTADHRGASVTLALPGRLETGGVDTGSLKLPDIGMMPGGQYFSRHIHWTLGVVLLASLAAWLALSFLIVRLGWPDWCIWIAFAVCSGLGARTPAQRWWWDAVGPKYVDRVLASGFCPSCAFSLAGLVVESDGCVVCPECGAAWKR